VYKIDSNKEKAIIVNLETPAECASSSMGELSLLTETAGGKVVFRVEQKKDKPDPAYFIGRGKADELRILKEEMGVELIIFNQELSPTQVRNLENVVGGKIIDRTALILDIFAKRALSREGKLQVELAQLSYLLPRLTGRGTDLSRLGGGIGTRGPGETQLEVDRRRIKKRISSLKGEIKQLKKHRHLHRYARKEKGYLLAALVGYTNAGKSTLLNALTGAQAFTEDKLFATLDPTTKLLPLEEGRVLLSDTVGFIHRLPPQLMDAFSATLEELREADLLLHVVDISDPRFPELIVSVNETLSRLDIEDKDEIMVFNKTDLLPPEELELQRQMLSREYPNCVFISAEQGKDLQQVADRIREHIRHSCIRLKLCIPYDRWPSFHYLYSSGNVINVDYHSEHALVEVDVPRSLADRLSSFIEQPEQLNTGGGEH